MSSKTEISNMAISHLGIGQEIGALDTEKSQEAAACRRFFDVAKQATLRDFKWPFARKYQALNLISENPNEEWLFEYRYPSDCLDIRKILNSNYNESRQEREPYIISKDGSGKTILANKSLASVEYTMDVTDTAFFPSDFILALSFRLAAYIAPRLTKGDPFKLGEKMAALYDLELNRAKSNGLNEQQDYEVPQSEFIRGRE